MNDTERDYDSSKYIDLTLIARKLYEILPNDTPGTLTVKEITDLDSYS